MHPITIDNAGSSTLTNFPVYVNLSFDSDMLSDYSDLRFYDTNDDILDYEIENYTATNAHIWVRIPSLPAAGINISVYYKNNTAVSSGENPTGVWDTNYQGVWHLNQTSGTISDSTETNDCTNTGGGMVLGASGIIDGGIQSDTNTDDLNCGTDSSLQPTSAITMSGWMRSLDNPEELHLMGRWIRNIFQ